MRPKRRLLLRVGGFLILFATLLYPWAWVSSLFTQTFGGVANAVVGATLDESEAHVRFVAADPRAAGEQTAGEWNTVLRIERSGMGPPSRMALGIRRLGYVPLATFVALVCVTPVAWRRKLALAGVGLALLLLRFALAVALPLARGFGGLREDGLAGWVTSVFYYSLIEPPNMMYGAPVIVWLLSLVVLSPESIAWVTAWSSKTSHPLR